MSLDEARYKELLALVTLALNQTTENSGSDISGVYTSAATITQAVRISGSNTAVAAQANSAANATIGFVKESDAGLAIVAYAGELPGFVGLVPGTSYYLSPTVAGGITSTPPASEGQIIQCVGYAKNATTLVIRLEPIVQL